MKKKSEKPRNPFVLPAKKKKAGPMLPKKRKRKNKQDEYKDENY